MINEKELISKLEKMAEDSREEVGLKEPALIRKIIDEVQHMAVNEEIKARIEQETSDKPRKLVDADCVKEDIKAYFNQKIDQLPYPSFIVDCISELQLLIDMEPDTEIYKGDNKEQSMKKDDLLIVLTDGETITVKSHTKCEYMDESKLFFIFTGTEVKAVIPRERVKYIIPVN